MSKNATSYMDNSKVENQPFLWSIITADRLKDWQIQNKQAIYIEHHCCLRVNRKSSVLKLPADGLLSGQSFKIATEQDLSDALMQAEASIRNDIKTIMRFRNHHSFVIPRLEMNIAAIAKQDRVYWQLGSVELSVEDYPTLDDVVRYVLAGVSTEKEQFFGGFHEAAWKRVLSEGMSDFVMFTEVRSRGEQYCWELFRDELSLTVQTFPRYVGDGYILCFGFHIDSFIDAIVIRKHIVESQWDQLLSSGVVDSYGCRFRVHAHATKTYDIELSLSTSPKERGLWAVPVPNLSQRFDDDDESDPFMMVPKGKTKRLKASTLREAIDEIANSTRTVFPNFTIFSWETISFLIQNGDKWTLEAHNARLDFVHGLLCVSFKNSRRYSEPVHLPTSLEFDAAFEAAWKTQAELS